MAMRRGRLIPQFTEVRRAVQDHDCDYCDALICLDQEYRREVSAYGTTLVIVKRHEFPDCSMIGRY